MSHNYCLNNTWDTTRCASNYCENNPTDEVCSANRSTSWVGKVALMYPSDYGYTYAKGVDETCYGEPTECRDRSNDTSDSEGVSYPDSGWIYNSINLESSTDIWNWLLSPYSGSSNGLFEIRSAGTIGSHNSTNDLYKVRPVVYLKSSIQITGGTGESTNPYVLSTD